MASRQHGAGGHSGSLHSDRLGTVANPAPAPIGLESEGWPIACRDIAVKPLE